MAKAINKENWRTIKGTLGRFVAIAAIVALGCGFFAGLRMTGVGMRKAADAFYDGSHLYDIQIVSTLGLTDNTVKDIEKIEGVGAVMPSRSVDVMATFGTEQYSCRISTLDLEAARASESDGTVVASGDDGYLNRLTLKSGDWPSSSDECVLSADRAMHEKVAIGDTVRVLYGTTDLDGVLEVREFKVVGFVSSPMYTNSTSLATTTLGTGILNQFMYVDESAFDADYPYTEVYVSVEGADQYLAWSDEYVACVDAVEDRIDDALDKIASDRQAEIKDAAQKTLDEQWETYRTEKADGEQQLADAYAEIEDGQKELDDAKVELDDAYATLVSGEQSYKDGVAQLAEKKASAQTQFADAQKTIDDKNAELESGQTQLDASQKELDSQKATVDAQADALLKQVQAFYPSVTSLEEAKTAVDASVAQIEQYDPENAQLVQLKQLQAGIDQILAAQSQIAQGQATIDEKQATIDQGSQQLAAAQAELDAQKASAEKQFAEAEATLESSRAQLDSGWSEYYDGYDEWQDGVAELADGRATYEKEYADAQEKFADAEKKLNDAQAEIDDVDAPELYVLDRAQNYGAESYKSDTERMDSIASVFPYFFFIVAALVALTTMTRMVDDERVQIGTLKALGYSPFAISRKYLTYALAASLVGALFGIGVMSQLLPAVISAAYSIMYNVPARPFPLPIEPGPAIMATLLGVGTTLGATLVACVSTLRETPASLMQPKAPKPGKRILLERIGFIWKRMSFSWKVTMRNIFRYKRRFFMTVIGIAGCTGLLLTGLGIRDAINDIIDLQFGEVWHYDTQVGLSEDATTSNIDDVVDYLQGTGDVEDIALAKSVNLVAGSDGAGSKTYPVQAISPEDPDEFLELVTMRNRKTHEAVEFSDDSVVLSEKLATNLGVSVGDTFTLYEQDTIGNATGAGRTLTVTGIVENYLGDLVYVGSNAFANDLGVDSSSTYIYAEVVEDTDVRDEIAQHLQTMENVDTVVFNDESIQSYREMLKSVDMVMGVLVVSAATLAFVVLYNLTNINIEERKREIASLKVLGFTKLEVCQYVFREILIIVVIGALTGLVVGYFFEGYVVVTAEVNRVMFGRSIHLLSYIYSFGLTLVFSVIVMFAMMPKLAKIDMVESLKSIE
jgi:putative ABC transport system permease protein